MSKKLCFLMSFVLALALIGTARADPIDVNNHSFEYDVNGVQITENTYIGNLQGWTLRDTTGWAGGWWFADDEWDAEGFEVADGTVAIFQVTGGDANNDPCDSCIIYQFPDDANAIIAENRRYTLTFNAIRLGTDTPIAYGALFYSLGGVNVPPANDVTLASKNALLTSPTWGEPGYAGWEEIKVIYTALSGMDSIGEALGVQLSVPYPWLDGYQVAMDNVRVEWSWAVNAFNPSPADEAEDVPRDVNLTWSPGTLADKHIVYFSDDFNKVSTHHQDANQGIQDVNIFDPTPGSGLLDPGQIFYWTITEVNDPNVWLGDIWSFTSGGKAKAVYPADWAGDIPALNLTLYWEAGLGAASHDVYFGTSQADVTDANTANTAQYPNVFRGNQLDVNDPNYPVPEDLEVGKSYFWRIDEVNTAAGTFATGNVWRFTTGVFLIVESFEPYLDPAALKAVWTIGHLTNNGAQLSLETVPDYIRDGDKSMLFAYRNVETKGPSAGWWGSEAEADIADLQSGTDWTAGGVEALVLYFYGRAGNGQEVATGYHINNDQMYVALEDGSAKIGIVKWPDMNDIQEASWHEWNISLQDPCLIAVDMNNIAKVYIGFGGQKTGQSANGAGAKSGNFDTVWFDDIKLYPPRCLPETTGIDVLHALGDLTEDCNTDYLDLDIMTTDWLVSDLNALAAPPADPPEVWYRFDDGPGKTIVKNDGSWGSGYDITIGSPNEPNEPAWTTDVAPAVDPCDPNYALAFDGVGDYLSIPNSAPNRFVGTQNMSITAWIMPTAAMAQWDWPSLVESRKASDSGYASGFGFGEYGELIYWWNNDYWDWHCDLWPDPNVWSFVAVTVEPTQATIYLGDGVDVNSATYTVPHAALADWDSNYNNLIAINTSTEPYRTFKGKIDDLRLYNKTLTLGEIMGLGGIAGQVYVPNESVANLFPKLPPPTSYNPNDPDIVNFRDYRILAENWLEQHPWP